MVINKFLNFIQCTKGEMRLKVKILLNFSLFIFLMGFTIAIIVFVRINRDLALQSKLLKEDMTRRENEILEGYVELFHSIIIDDTRARVHQAARNFSETPGLAFDIIANHSAHLNDNLTSFCHNEEMDFAFIFDTNEELKVSFPENVNTEEIEKYYASWILAPQVRAALQGHGQSMLHAITSHDKDFLKLLGFEDRAMGKGAISIVSARIIKDDTGDFIGFCVMGKLLNNYTAPLENLHRCTNAAFSLYLHTIPLAHSGFENEEGGNFNEDSLIITNSVLRRKIYKDSNIKKIKLDIAGESYMSACSPLIATDGEKIGFLCVSLSDNQIKRSIERMYSYNNDTKSNIQLWIIVISLIMFLLALFLGNLLVNSIVNPILSMIQIAQNISNGDLSNKIEVQVKGELAELASAMNTMEENLSEMAQATKEISKGNFSINFKPKSKYDVLGNALLKMTNDLKELSVNNQKQNWINTGQSNLSDLMRGEQDIISLSQKIISFLVTYLEAQIGALYLADKNKILKLTGSYAYTQRKNLSNEYNFGESMVGQAALEKRSIIISNVPDDYIKISSGLGETTPRSILVSPFLKEHEVRGVIEIGSLDKFTDLHIDFLNLISESIAISFEIVQSSSQMKELLEKTQEQAQELQAQQEELKTNNNELEEQAKALKASELKLQEQQEELQQTNEELEERSEQLERQKREVEKKNQELKKAKDLLEQKARELESTSTYKSEFLANMSHELRTPLNSLLILSQQLSDNKEGRLSEKEVEYARTIHSSGTDLLNLINEVLDLSKVEAGKIDINITTLLITDIPPQIKQIFMPLTQKKNISLDVHIAEGLPAYIRTDPHRVSQIIKNLLSNAIKFTHQGGITVTISRPSENSDCARIGLDPQKAIVISVADTGLGIPENKQKLIFDAFTQVDGSINRKYGGTGLGLSISRKLSRLLGGEIFLRSTEGTGSTFTLYLPESLEKVDSELSKEIAETQITPKPLPHKPQELNDIRDDRREIKTHDTSLLIIEDDPKFSKILLNLAHEKGYKCLIAGDGETGLQLAEYYRPTAIILDISLPGIDGWTVMERLKTNSTTRTIPVHFITGSEKNIRGLQMGAIGFLTKPVNRESLDDAFKKIEEVVSKNIKKILVVEDQQELQESIRELVSNKDIKITLSTTISDTCSLLKNESFDCIILDPSIENKQGLALLEKIKQDSAMDNVPILLYSSKALSQDEQSKLLAYTDDIVVKEIKSAELLLDEIVLFLHLVEENLPQDKQKMLRMVHNKEDIMRNKRILLADDDIRNIFAISSVLEEKGMFVIAAKNGQEALEWLDRTPDIDLVLMDIMMPVMDGYKTMKEIRKQERFKELPIIAFTAKAMRGDKKFCLEAGANDYLSKPIDVDKLLSALRVWLYNKR
ncbi:MAG: response regulator [bacterium]